MNIKGEKKRIVSFLIILGLAGTVTLGEKLNIIYNETGSDEESFGPYLENNRQDALEKGQEYGEVSVI